MPGLASMGLMGLLMGPEAVDKTKGYMAQHRAGRRKITGSVMPGGVPPMKKISEARQNLRRHLIKQSARGGASTGAMAASLPAALLMGAGLAAGGLIATGGASGITDMWLRHRSERMYEELKRRYPEIKRHPKAREYFDMIVAYAPSLMRHPTAIGDFLKRQLEYPMTSVEFIKQLADLEGTVSKTETYSTATRFGRGVESGAGSVITPIAMSEGTSTRRAGRSVRRASSPKPPTTAVGKKFLHGYPGGKNP